MEIRILRHARRDEFLRRVPLNILTVHKFVIMHCVFPKTNALVSCNCDILLFTSIFFCYKWVSTWFWVWIVTSSIPSIPWGMLFLHSKFQTQRDKINPIECWRCKCTYPFEIKSIQQSTGVGKKNQFSTRFLFTSHTCTTSYCNQWLNISTFPSVSSPTMKSIWSPVLQ
jgi:hypothetical protein